VSHLVPIRREGRGPPLFAVHSMAGELTWLPPLAAALAPRHAVFGFAAPGFTHPGPPYSRVEEMAAAYLDAALPVAEDRPWLLLGYSFGGIIAFEMAQQAARRGLAPAELLLLDAYAPSSPPIRALPRWASNGTLVQLATNLIGLPFGLREPLGPGELMELSVDGQIEAAVRQLKARSDIPHAPELLSRHLRQSLDGMAHHAQMMGRYHPTPQASHIPTLFIHNTQGFVSEENPLRLPRIWMKDPSPISGWNGLLHDDVRRVGVETEHFRMTLQPTWSDVCRIIVDALRAHAEPPPIAPLGAR
jgi:thioesterase domain-containing protein